MAGLTLIPGFVALIGLPYVFGATLGAGWAGVVIGLVLGFGVLLLGVYGLSRLFTGSWTRYAERLGDQDGGLP